MKHFNERLTDEHGNYAAISIKATEGHALIEFGNGCHTKIEITDPDQLRAIGHAFNLAAATMTTPDEFGVIRDEIDNLEIEMFPWQSQAPWKLLSIIEQGRHHSPDQDEVILSSNDNDDFLRLINLIYRGII